MTYVFAGSLLDRADPKRRDAEWLEARLHDPSSQFVQFAGSRPAVKVNANGTPQTILHDSPPLVDPDIRESVFLGNGEGRAVFAIPLPIDGAGKTAIDLPDGIDLFDMRPLASQGVPNDHELGLLSQARSMLQWHEAHQFCSSCGAPSEMADGGYRRTCPKCKRDHFPRTDPVVMIVVVDGDCCLLGRAYNFSPGSYSALSGFVEPGETIEEAARREVYEESGIDMGRITYHSSQPWPFVSSLMIGLMGEAKSRQIARNVEEVEDIRWFTRAEVRQMLCENHPEGLTTARSLSIAYHLIKAFADSV